MARLPRLIVFCVLLPSWAAAQLQSEVAASTRASAQDGISVWASVTHTDAARLAGIERDLKQGLWNARIHAVHELEPYGPAGLPLLEYAARDADWQVRLTAVHFLGRLGLPALRSLAEVMRQEPCRHVRITAIHWLGSLGPESSPILDGALADESGMARLTGRYWLRKVGQEDASAFAEGLDAEAARREDLMACLPASEPGRLASARRLERPAASAPPAEIAELDLPPSASAALQAAPEKGSLPEPPALPKRAAMPTAPPSLPPSVRERELELDKLLADNPPEDLPGAQALPRHQDGTASQAPALAQAALRRGEPDLSLGAPARAPEDFPKGPPAARPPATPEPEVALALDHGRPKPENDPLPGLIKTLRQGDAPARARAADEAGKRGAQAAAALPALLEDLRHPDPRVRASAALAMGNIGPAADSAVPALVRALKDQSEDVQWSAAVALGRLGTPRARRAFRRYLREQAGSVAQPGRTD